jgi:hypothetical protein
MQIDAQKTMLATEDMQGLLRSAKNAFKMYSKVRSLPCGAPPMLVWRLS